MGDPKNYVTETDLKGFVPELSRYIWTGDTDYSREKAQAERVVRADLQDRGFQLRNLRPELILDDTDPNEYEDIGNRSRAIAVCTTVTGTATVTITGVNDIEDTYETAGTSGSLAVGDNTFLLDDYFKFYKYAVTGTATVTDVFLVEADNYDLLFTYKWLEIILMNKVVEENDQFHLKAKEFRDKYNDRWRSFQPFYDADEDGNIVSSEKQTSMVTQIIQH